MSLKLWYVASRYLSIIKFAKMMTLGWPWLILQQGQIWSFQAFEWEKVKQNIVVYDMKVGRCIQVNEYMTHNVYVKGQGHSVILAQGLSDWI